MKNITIYGKNSGQIFLLEPYSKNESWQWLHELITTGDLSISIREMAHIWKWHRSKVERFITLLKKEAMIETRICARKLVISLAKKPISAGSSCTTKSVARQEPDSKFHEQDIKHDCNKTPIHKEQQEIYLNGELAIETSSRHKQDSSVGSEFLKKEKNQKKETFEVNLIKEKNTPYGSTKKENFKSLPALRAEVRTVMPEDVDEFANKLGIGHEQLTWELAKFKDYWLTSSKTQPKDGIAAFRNWLRKSIEFSKTRGNYERFNKTRTKNAGFDQFIAAGNRAIAEYERDRLDRKIDGGKSDLFASDSCSYQGLKNVSAVN